MSLTAHHTSKRVRALCESCRERKARFQYRGEVRADRDHTLCFECFRSERNRRRAHALAKIDVCSWPLSHAVRRLTAAQIEHRRRMLTHHVGLSMGGVP